MLKLIILFTSLFIAPWTYASTQIWVGTEKAVILLDGNGIERDAINLYDALKVPETRRQIDGLSVAYKELSFTAADGSRALDVFCSKSTDGTDLGQCYLTLERSLLTWFDESSQQAVVTINDPYEARKWAQSFSLTDRYGHIYSSKDGCLNIYVKFVNGAVSSFNLRYIP